MNIIKGVDRKKLSDTGLNFKTWDQTYLLAYWIFHLNNMSNICCQKHVKFVAK